MPKSFFSEGPEPVDWRYRIELCKESSRYAGWIAKGPQHAPYNIVLFSAACWQSSCMSGDDPLIGRYPVSIVAGPGLQSIVKIEMPSMGAIHYRCNVFCAPFSLL